jgi:hypothetical protein
MGDDEKARYQEAARREGKTLSLWLREAAEEKYRASAGKRSLATREELQAFWAECDARHAGEGPEPDWEVHKAHIEAARMSPFNPMTVVPASTPDDS